MDERMRFVSACLENELSMTELCRQFGISRETGYKWLRRYEAFGPGGLSERPRSPGTHPNATADSVLDALREIRAERPTYGPKKLLIIFRRRYPRVQAPAKYDQKLLRSEDTRLNSSHQIISYAVFCLKKKKKQK